MNLGRYCWGKKKKKRKRNNPNKLKQISKGTLGALGNHES